MARRAIMALIWTCGLAVTGSAWGQFKPEKFCRPEAFDAHSHNPLAYAPRAGGEFCDGALFERHARSGDLELISVLARSNEAVSPGPPLKMKIVGFNQSPGKLAGPFRFQGLARSGERNYRLDALLETANAILKIGEEAAMWQMDPPLKFSHIGWSAWIDSESSGRTYYPVQFANATPSGVEIVVRPTIPAAYVTVEVTSQDGGVLLAKTKLAAEVPKNSPVSFELPPGKVNLVKVNMLAVGYRGKTQAVSLRVVRPSIGVLSD